MATAGAYESGEGSKPGMVRWNSSWLRTGSLGANAQERPAASRSASGPAALDPAFHYIERGCQPWPNMAS